MCPPTPALTALPRSVIRKPAKFTNLSACSDAIAGEIQPLGPAGARAHRCQPPLQVPSKPLLLAGSASSPRVTGDCAGRPSWPGYTMGCQRKGCSRHVHRWLAAESTAFTAAQLCHEPIYCGGRQTAEGLCGLCTIRVPRRFFKQVHHCAIWINDADNIG